MATDGSASVLNGWRTGTWPDEKELPPSWLTKYASGKVPATGEL